jgi:hypothetical protein
LGNNISPAPHEQDVHLSVLLHGIRLDFAACMSAALAFIQEARAIQCCDAISVTPDDPQGLPRLPNERLYLGPHNPKANR